MESEAKTGDTCESAPVDEARLREIQEQLVDGAAAARLAQTFKALSDPTRVRIVSALSHNELCVHELAACLQMSQSAISHQLRTLRYMRLVRFRKEGRHVYYALDDEHIHDLFDRGLAHIEHE
ncbi:MAG: ArsR/SmtB family transcription factor [Anaerolineae bacterium]